MLIKADSYERTYSQLLQTDFAIACALQGVPEGPSAAAECSNDRLLAEQLQAEQQQAEQRLQQERQEQEDHDLAVSLQEQEQATHGMRRRKSRRQLRRLDKQLRRLLSTLDITKVIPRLNPSLEPSANYVSEDRKRLLLRLDMYALRERVVVGDGNCQFRSLADQLWFQQDRHNVVREAVAAQLLAHPERYRDYVLTTDYGQYIQTMSRPGEWGDHVTLQAAADAFSCRICIVSSFLDNCVISISPTTDASDEPEAGQQELLQQAGKQLAEQQGHGLTAASDRTLWLSFWAEVHYNSLAPKAPAGPSASDTEGSASSSSDADDADDLGRRHVGSRLKQAAGHMVPSMLRR